MFPPATPGFAPQQWSAFAAMPGQPAVANAQAFQVGVDSNSVVLGDLHPGYVRMNHSAAQSPSVLLGSPMHSTSAQYTPHHTVGYTLQPPVEAPLANRQLQNANLANPFQLTQFPQPCSVSQPLPFSHASVPYGHSFPYLHPLLSSVGNGGLGQVQHCANIQSPAQLGVPTAPSLDSIRQLGSLSQEQSRRTKPKITSKTNLYIRGLEDSDTDETVRSLVQGIVQPKSCKAMVTNGTCRGFGFIDCASEDDAEKARNHIIEHARRTGRPLQVKFADENEKDELNVYVTHLPLDFTKEKLEDLFREFGQITSVRLLENEDRLTGIGFVRFTRPEQATGAIEQINAKKLTLGSNTAPVRCKLADKAKNRIRLLACTHNSSPILQAPIHLNNHMHRQTVPVGAASTLFRSSMPLSQTQSAAFAPPVHLATQLLPSLNQPHVILQNIQPQSAPTHSRGVLSPGLLPNGTTGASPLLPLSFPSGTLNANCPIASNRATPLINLPPQVTLNLQRTQNHTIPTAHYDGNNCISKSVNSSPAPRFHGLQASSLYMNNDNAQMSTNGVQPTALPNAHYGSVCNQHPVQTTCSTGSVSANSHLLYLTPTSLGSTSDVSTSILPVYTNNVTQSQPQFPSAYMNENSKHLPSPSPSIVQQTNQFMIVDSSVDLVASTMQNISVMDDEAHPDTEVSSEHNWSPCPDPIPFSAKPVEENSTSTTIDLNLDVQSTSVCSQSADEPIIHHGDSDLDGNGITLEFSSACNTVHELSSSQPEADPFPLVTNSDTDLNGVTSSNLPVKDSSRTKRAVNVSRVHDASGGVRRRQSEGGLTETKVNSNTHKNSRRRKPVSNASGIISRSQSSSGDVGPLLDSNESKLT